MSGMHTSSSLFYARYPDAFVRVKATNPISSAVNKVYEFVHKKIGLHILVSQRNPSNFTFAEGERGHKKLKEIGGKIVQFETADNVLINAMHFIGKDCVESSPTLILFNGNGLRYEEYGSQTFSDVSLFTISKWQNLRVNVLIFNYRGIDKNKGCATRDGLILDGDAALQYVRDVLKVPENKIIFHGHSLGAGIASEVAVMHPQVNFCNDRSFSSLSQQVKMMFGGGILGSFASKILTTFGWEYNTVANWEKIKGHKWVIYHPHDPVICEGARFIDVIKSVNSKVNIIEMLPQWFKTKRGMRPENIALLVNPTSQDKYFSECSSHMRELCGPEENASYEVQINAVNSKFEKVH